MDELDYVKYVTTGSAFILPSAHDITGLAFNILDVSREGLVDLPSEGDLAVLNELLPW